MAEMFNDVNFSPLAPVLPLLGPMAHVISQKISRNA